MKKLSVVISYLFHPVFMPLLGMWIILSITHMALLPQESKRAILMLVAIITLLFPISLVPFMYFKNMISEIKMSERKQRLFPLFFITGFYFFGYYMLHRYSAPLFLQNYMLAVFVSVFLASLINLKWKISLHMIGTGGIVGLLSALSVIYNINYMVVLSTAIIMAGIAGSARLILREHTSAQIYVGFLTGYIATFAVLFLTHVV